MDGGSLHKETRGGNKGQWIQSTPDEASWYNKEIFYSESSQTLGHSGKQWSLYN